MDCYSKLMTVPSGLATHRCLPVPRTVSRYSTLPLPSSGHVDGARMRNPWRRTRGMWQSPFPRPVRRPRWSFRSHRRGQLGGVPCPCVAHGRLSGRSPVCSVAQRRLWDRPAGNAFVTAAAPTEPRSQASEPMPLSRHRQDSSSPAVCRTSALRFAASPISITSACTPLRGRPVSRWLDKQYHPSASPVRVQ